MKHFAFLIVFILPIFACKEKDEPPTEVQPFTKLVWSDEFDKDGAPEQTKWNYDLGDGCPDNCGWGNNELEYYTNDAKNVRVKEGKLIIEALKEDKAGKSYTSTRIISKGKGDWLYGRIEINAKLPKGKGTWPAIWMLSTDWSYGGWPASGEIDIMEHVGFDPGVIHGTIHTELYNHIKGTQKEGKVTVNDVQDAFHVYAIEWTKTTMSFYVDSTKYYSVTKSPSDDFKGWPFDKRFHLLLNLAVGGNWGGMQGVDESIWPQRMEVEYVRVYQ
ncbi:MAG: glycoside hydrolase family 16 protein [Chryseolinea sp.]